MPVFQTLGIPEDALADRDEVRERFMNPFVDHKIADVAQNHAQNEKWRIVPLPELAASLAPK
ncbi:hypothetical protein NDK50_12535 [Paraburkholderia bryophila]|uniref:hypothetical protein n=1 Tax=Paraburkholderia bryophila TaxID=420952 RepID=UPI0023496DCA|nr:hypothetical protein [Paraburkholderia bryophila]WCM18295.1 hypothetical protein NDK50_12535 [Paraburkholderia bryophila]